MAGEDAGGVSHADARFTRFMAGGAAMATKWSGLTAVVTAIALGFIWEVMRRKRYGLSKPIAKTITTEGFGLVLALLVTPCIVYVASYIPWFLHFGWDLQRWAEVQGKAARFHADLKAQGILSDEEFAAAKAKELGI